MSVSVLLLTLVACQRDYEIEKVKEKTPEGVADLSIDPGIVDFGVLADNGTVTDVVTLTSVGVLPVTISSIAVSGSTAFTVTVDGEELVLQPGESTELVVSYTPQSASDHGQIVVKSDGVLRSQVVDLLGAGTYPALIVDPSSVYLASELGEHVTEQVTVTSVGTTDLVLSSMIPQGDQFTVTAADSYPLTLPPGESTTLTVEYTPESEGETVSGKIWFGTNTASGYAVVPLEGHWGPVCVGLGEAWDRGDIGARMAVSGALYVENFSSDTEVCIDHWYVWISDGSQDLGAGDMDGDVGGQYPYGSLTMSAGGSETFQALEPDGPAWWCMEETQVTSRNQEYWFTGARVPEPMLSYMKDADQDASWAWQLGNPVMIAARETNLLEFTQAGGSAPVTLRIINMGGMDGTAEVREAVPHGYSASNFSQEPIATETNDDGDTVYVFAVSLEARQETPIDQPTDYDWVEISYTLSVPGCEGRTYVTPMETRWTDSNDRPRTDTANPLTIVCE